MKKTIIFLLIIFFFSFSSKLLAQQRAIPQHEHIANIFASWTSEQMNANDRKYGFTIFGNCEFCSNPSSLYGKITADPIPKSNGGNPYWHLDKQPVGSNYDAYGRPIGSNNPSNTKPGSGSGSTGSATDLEQENVR